MPKTAALIQEKILSWYDRNRRDLPWRAKAGDKSDPYAVWISEIMLQQTTVPAVMKYFPRFMNRFPRLEDLAKAPLDQVLVLWQGLGYYARARNMHKAAQILWRDHKGAFPDSLEGLRRLPGIGEYTAGAIAAIAFGQKSVAIDANVERVLARLYAVTQPFPSAKKQLRALAQNLAPDKKAGDFWQALMDLGSSVCVSGKPFCGSCPVQKNCLGFARNIAATLPRKAEKKIKPVRYGQAFLVRNAKGQILLRKRAGKSILGDMVELPSSDWDSKTAEKRAASELPAAEWKKIKGGIRHSFTHFDLHLDIYAANSNRKVFKDGFWHNIGDLHQMALPTLFKKAIRKALGG